MAQWFRTLVSLAEGPGSIPSTHVVITTIVAPILGHPKASMNTRNAPMEAYIYVGKTFIHIKLNKVYT